MMKETPMTQSLEILHSIYSDMYKEVYGTRPRGFRFDTVEEAEKAIDALYPEVQRAIQDDNEDYAYKLNT